MSASSPRAFVVGGVGIDEVLRTDRSPVPGGYARVTERTTRVGGCGLNVACGMAGVGVQTVLVGCVGSDDNGARLLACPESSGVEVRIAQVHEPSPISLIAVGPDGERTIFGLNDDLLGNIPVSAVDAISDADQNDVVVFPVWRPEFSELLGLAHARRARTVVGLRAIEDPSGISADLAIGSERELPEAGLNRTALDRFSAVVVTAGVNGAYAYTADRVLYQPPFKVVPTDCIGAGDSFLAFFVATWLGYAKLEDCLRGGAAAGALAVTRSYSTPPPERDVAGLLSASGYPPSSVRSVRYAALDHALPKSAPPTRTDRWCPRMVDPHLVRQSVAGHTRVLAAWQYGSSLRDDYIEGSSDVDILLVLSHGSPTHEYAEIAHSVRQAIPEAEVTLLTVDEVRKGIHPGWSRHYFRNVSRSGVRLFGPDVLAIAPPTSLEDAQRRVLELAQRARIVIANPSKSSEAAFWLAKYQHWIPLCLLEILDLAGLPHDHLRYAHSDFAQHFPGATAPVEYPFRTLSEAHAFLEDLGSWLNSSPEPLANTGPSNSAKIRNGY